MTAASIHSFLENDPFYRGQIVHRYIRPAFLSRTKQVILNDGEFDPYESFGKLYKHQADFVESLREGNDSLLVSTFGSGRTTSSMLYSLDKLFNQQKSVLFISYNGHEKEMELKQLKSVLNSTKYDWLVDIYDLSDGSKFDENGFPSVFPSISVVEAKDLHGRILQEHWKYKTLFESLGLVVIDDLDKYSGIPSGNLHWMLRRLEVITSFYQAGDKNIQYLVTSKPFYENEGITNLLFKRRFSPFYGDNKEVNESRVFMWVPAFAKDKSIYSKDNDLSVRKIIRDSIIDDAYITAYLSAKQGRKTVLYYAGLHISKSDLQKRERYQEYAGINLEDNVITGNDFGKITSELSQNGWGWSDIDTIIIACLMDSPISIRDDLMHCGKPGCEIYLMMPQSPAYQFYINHPEFIGIKKSIKDIVKADHNSVFNLNEEEETIIEKHITLLSDELSFFGLNSIAENSVEKQIGRNLINDTDLRNFHKSFTSETHGLDFFSTEIQSSFKAKNESNEIIAVIENAQVPDQFFKNAITVIEDQRYSVSEVNIDKREIFLRASAEKADFKIGKPVYSISLENEVNSIKYGSVKFEIKNLQASATFDKYILYNADPHSNEVVSLEGINTIDDLKFNALVVSDFPKELSEELASVLLSSLKSRIIIQGFSPKYFIRDNKIYIYNLGKLQSSSFLLNDTIIGDLLSRALQLLIDCPCRDGCPGCLEIPEIEHNHNKKDLIKYLSEFNLFDTDYLTEIIRWKFEHIDGIKTEDGEKLRAIRDVALEILEKRTLIKINNLYPERFVSKPDREWMKDAQGVCVTKRDQDGNILDGFILVKTNMFEDELYSLLAHEYIHNWQQEGNLSKNLSDFDIHDMENNSILFAGKIFVEGQANWAATKVLDYFGLKHMVFADEIYGKAEYKYGFILLNNLEKEFGLRDTIKILKDGKLPSEDIGSIEVSHEILNEWYDTYGLKSLIGNYVKTVMDNDGLKCLTINYLDKREDFNRYSFHISHDEVGVKVTDTDVMLTDLLGTEDYEREKNANTIWRILKDHFGIKPKNGYDQLPCLSCSYLKKETLDGMCMLFGSIDVRKAILDELNDTG